MSHFLCVAATIDRSPFAYDGDAVMRDLVAEMMMIERTDRRLTRRQWIRMGRRFVRAKWAMLGRKMTMLPPRLLASED